MKTLVGFSTRLMAALVVNPRHKAWCYSNRDAVPIIPPVLKIAEIILESVGKRKALIEKPLCGFIQRFLWKQVIISAFWSSFHT